MNPMRRLIFAFVACVLLTDCATLPPQPATEAFSQYSPEQQAIYLAILDAMFEHWKWEGAYYKIQEHYFVSLNQRDAPDDLLAMLRAKGYHVEVGTRWKERTGVELSMEAIKWKSPTRVTVYGGYLYGSVGGEWGPFVLVKRNGKWRVVDWTVDMLA